MMKARLSAVLRALHLKRKTPAPIARPVQFIWGGWDDDVMRDASKDC
jgi:hypothetical protein